MKKTLTWAFALLFAAAMTGCEDAPTDAPVADDHGDHDHDHGEHSAPESFGAAFAQLEEMRDVIGGEDEEAAHSELHHVTEVITALSKFTADSELSQEAKDSITANLKTVKEGFDSYDALMHGQEDGKEWSEVEESVDNAIAAIEETAGDLAAHSHGDDEHAGEDGHGEHGDHDEHGDHKDGDHDEDGDHDKGDADHKEGDHDEDKEHDKGDGDGDAEHKDGDADGEKAEAKEGDAEADKSEGEAAEGEADAAEGEAETKESEAETKESEADAAEGDAATEAEKEE